MNKRYPFQKSWRWRFVRAFDFLLDPFTRRLPAGKVGIRRQLFPDPVQNILVIRLDHMGDLVCALPVFPVLKRRFPQAKITALTGGEGEAILKGNPYVDRLLVFRSNWFYRKGFINVIEFFRTLPELRKTRYDLGFDLRGDLRNIMLMVLAGVHYRIGYGIAGGGALLHEAPPYDTALHQVELNARLVSEESAEKNKLKPEFYLSEDEKIAAQNRLKAFGVSKGARLVAVHPEAGYPSKEWEEEKFEKLVEKFLEDSQNNVVILGLSKARKLADYFSGSDRIINFVGTLSLREMMAVLSQCRLFVGNDSGPSHLAHALGIPTVVIASGTNEYEKWGIWNGPSKILKHAVPCSPCHLKDCVVEGHPCMSEISVNQVLEAAQELTCEGKR